jgi:hypothetical protein
VAAREPGATAERVENRRWAVWALAAAAAILVGVGVTLLLRAGDTRSPTDSPPDTLERLAARLRTTEPERLGDFRPLAADELRPLAAERGGLPVYAPLGRIAAGQPVIDWQSATGATGYEVTVVDEDGTTRFAVEVPVPPLAFPADRAAPLPPGAYVVEVKAKGVPSAAGARAFVVVPEDERLRFERAQGAIAAHTTGARGRLLQAHHALRSDWISAALVLAREAVAEAPSDPDATAFLRHVESRVGLPAR